MSLKSLVQIFIILVILIILGGVYYNYFAENKKISLEDNENPVVNFFWVDFDAKVSQVEYQIV